MSSSVGLYLVDNRVLLLRPWHHRWTCGFQGEYIPNRRLRLSAAAYRGLQENAAQQKADSADFLPVPGSKSSAALSLAPTNSYLELGIFVLLCAVGFVI